MYAHHDHDVLEDGQADLLRHGHRHIDEHTVGCLVAKRNQSERDWVISDNLHLGNIADVLGRVSHCEIEVKADEGIEEVELCAVEHDVALKLKLE